MTDSKKGLLYAFLAYLSWALLSFYWKALGGVPAYSTFAYRIVWTFLTMLAYFFVTGKRQKMTNQLSGLWQSPKSLIRMILASLFIALNWLTYIYAVGNGQATEASLGYYLMPLVSVCLSVFFLREKLALAEWFAVGLASLGVLLLLGVTGRLPLISLILALSFGIYGLLKKQVILSSDLAMLVEAGFILPFALIYLVFFSPVSWFSFSLTEQVLLFLSGLITAIPLLLFAEAVKRAPLSQVGFIQYLNPTLQLLIAVFIFQEGITAGELMGFSLIWLAVLLFIAIQVLRLRQLKEKRHQTK